MAQNDLRQVMVEYEDYYQRERAIVSQNTYSLIAGVLILIVIYRLATAGDAIDWVVVGALLLVSFVWEKFAERRGHRKGYLMGYQDGHAEGRDNTIESMKRDRGSKNKA